MSPSNCKILPVSSADVPTLTNLLHASKLSLSINRLLWTDWPNEKAQKAAYGGAVSGALDNPSATSLKVVNDHTGDITGYIAFERKHPSPSHDDALESSQNAQKPQGPDGANPDVIAELGRALPIVAGEVQGIDRYEILYICVQQPHQRHGIGKKLMQTCFDKAKDEGVPVAVCAEPAALEFFLQLRMRETKHADMDLAKFAAPFSGFGLFRLTGLIWHPQELRG